MEDQFAYSGNSLVDRSTGEIINKTALKKAAQKHILDTQKQVSKEMLEMGIYVEVRIIKDNFGEEYKSFNIKENYEFNKIFRVELMELFQTAKLCAESYAFIGRFTPCLHFPSNSLILNGTHPSQEDMKDAIGIGKTKLNEVLKELEYYNIIKREKILGKVYIFFNPFLYSTGVVSIDTYRLFRDSIFNPYRHSVQEVNNKEDKKRKKVKKSIV